MAYINVGTEWGDTIRAVGDGTDPMLYTYYLAGGDDFVSTNRQSSILHGEAGNDTLSAGTNSSLYGGDGDDRILIGETITIREAHGDAGNDYIDARGRFNSLNGGSGDDTIMAGENAFVKGGDGNDVLDIDGNLGRIYGEGGDDLIDLSGTGTINGGDGNDTITGGGSPTIYSRIVLEGGAGDDVMTARQWAFITDEVGHGSDTILLQGGGYVGIFADTASGNDSYVNTGAGKFSAELYFGNFTTGMSLDFASGAASGLELGNDTIMGFTTITLGRGDDTVLGSSSRSETIDAFVGDDLVQGRGGRDWLDGSAGNDTLDGGAGADRLFAGFDANDGNDILKGRGGNDYLVSGADELGRGGGNDRMYGGAGNDTLKDGGGNDSMYGGAGNDWLTHTKGGNDQMYGGAGADVFSARGEFPTGDIADILDFEDGVDRICMNEGFDPSDAVQVGDHVEIGSLRIHNFTLAQLDLSDFIPI